MCYSKLLFQSPQVKHKEVELGWSQTHCHDPVIGLPKTRSLPSCYTLDTC